MKSRYSELTKKFEAQEIDPGTFGHKEHVRVACEMLHRYSFLDASARYVKGVSTMARAHFLLPGVRRLGE